MKLFYLFCCAFALTLPLLLNGCDSKTTDSNTSTTTTTATSQMAIENDMPPTVLEGTPSRPLRPAPKGMDIGMTGNTVTPNGFGGLTFGQEITDDLLNELGLIKDDNIINESCYYVHDPKLTHTDANLGKRASVLYQIVDGKMALISIEDPSIPFYTGVRVGDTPARVMSVHDDAIAYEADKYATDGDYYQLLHHINFEVNSNKSSPPDMGQVLTKENYQLNDNGKKHNQTTPLQIKYKFKNGQSLGQTNIASNAWADDDKGKLTGTLYTIDIGERHAIDLVEGCS